MNNIMKIAILNILIIRNVHSDGAYTTWNDPLFTRNVVATADPGWLLGGVAFASDGDILSVDCGTLNSLYRFDTSTTTLFKGSTLFSLTIIPAPQPADPVWCGMTNHPNGKLYVNTNFGVMIRDPDTNANLGGPFGIRGNLLGITVKGDDVYYACFTTGFTPTTCKLNTIDNTATIFGFPGVYVDGIGWNADGSILWHAHPNGAAPLLIGMDTSGSVVHTLSLSHAPDGIAFHPSTGSIFLNNLDGTITRIFEDDLNTEILFASGGFRGDLSAIGSDGCWYLTQNGVLYENGEADSSLDSIVQVCPDFANPIGDDCQRYGADNNEVCNCVSNCKGKKCHAAKAGRSFRSLCPLQSLCCCGSTCSINVLNVNEISDAPNVSDGDASAIINDNHDKSPDMFGTKDAKPMQTYSILTVIIIAGLVVLVSLIWGVFKYFNKKKVVKELKQIEMSDIEESDLSEVVCETKD